MDERAKRILEESRNFVATAGPAAALASAAGASPGLVAVTGAAAGLQPILAGLFAWGQNARAAEAKKWWHEVVHKEVGDGVTAEEIAGIIAAKEDEPAVRDTVYRSLRGLADALDPCVVTPLAVLAREYIRENRPPDFYFRGALSLLTWCSRDAFEQLQQVARQVVQYFALETISDVQLHAGVHRDGVMRVSRSNGDGVDLTLPEATRLVRRLCLEELGVELDLWKDARSYNEVHCSLLRDPGLRFARLVLS